MNDEEQKCGGMSFIIIYRIGYMIRGSSMLVVTSSLLGEEITSAEGQCYLHIYI